MILKGLLRNQRIDVPMQKWWILRSGKGKLELETNVEEILLGRGAGMEKEHHNVASPSSPLSSLPSPATLSKQWY